MILASDEKLQDLTPKREFGGGFKDFDFEKNPSFYFNPEE